MSPRYPGALPSTLPAEAVTALTDPAWLAYQEWMAGNVVVRYGRASQSGFMAGFRVAASAGPSWATITPAQRSEHFDVCRDGCVFCADHRAFGECRSCGGQSEALGADELSRCCLAPTILGPEDRS